MFRRRPAQHRDGRVHTMGAKQLVPPLIKDRAWASLLLSLPQCTAGGQPQWPTNDETPCAAARPVPMPLRVTEPGRSIAAKVTIAKEAWQLDRLGTASLHSPWCITQHQGHRACLAQIKSIREPANKLI